jgi:uncharacterized membrane protein
MAKKNQQLVLAFFDTEAAADAAVEALKKWDKATDAIKLGAIGVLVKDEKGKIKTNKLGSRKTGKGALIFGLVGLLSGGMTVVGGLIFGAIAGSLFHTGLGMSKDDVARIGKDLDGGKAGVALVVNADEVEAVSAKLAELGGAPETHEVTDEAVEQAAAAAEAAPEAEAAAPAADAAPEAEATAPAAE